MILRSAIRTSSSLIIRRLFSKDSSSLTPTDSSSEGKKDLSTKKSPTQIATPKRAFTLIDPKTMHQIQRVDQMPINNEIDYIRHRLTENR